MNLRPPRKEEEKNTANQPLLRWSWFSPQKLHTSELQKCGRYIENGRSSRMQNLRSCRGTTIGYRRAPSKTHDRHVQHELHEPAAACTRACPPDRTQHAPTPPIHALCVVPCLGLLSHRRRPPFPQIGRPIDSKVSARPPRPWLRSASNASYHTAWPSCATASNATHACSLLVPPPPP